MLRLFKFPCFQVFLLVDIMTKLEGKQPTMLKCWIVWAIAWWKGRYLKKRNVNSLHVTVLGMQRRALAFGVQNQGLKTYFKEINIHSKIVYLIVTK